MKNDPQIWLNDIHFPKAHDNKYTRGHVLINGGEYECTGAAKLSANACSKLAGMVTVACSKKTLPIYAASFTCIMNRILDNDEIIEFIKKRKVRAVLIGPGNGVNENTRKLVLKVLKLGMPTVLDADALTAFENDQKTLVKNLHANCILTPHEGEFERLFHLKGKKETIAKKAAEMTGAIIVLKGNKTIITDGNVLIESTAKPTLATAGSGDVLAGIISGLLANGTKPLNAAACGVYIHSKCADRLGQGITADDIAVAIPNILDDIIKMKPA